MADQQIPSQRPPAQFFNIMQVSHTPREFFFILGQSQGSQAPDQGYVEVQVISNVVTTPQHGLAVLPRYFDFFHSILKLNQTVGFLIHSRPMALT